MPSFSVCVGGRKLKQQKDRTFAKNSGNFLKFVAYFQVTSRMKRSFSPLHNTCVMQETYCQCQDGENKVVICAMHIGLLRGKVAHGIT